MHNTVKVAEEANTDIQDFAQAKYGKLFIAILSSLLACLIF
jgi:hypothetical protein